MKKVLIPIALSLPVLALGMGQATAKKNKNKPCVPVGTVTTVESYDAAMGELPEGVAVAPNGDIFVTLAPTGEVRKIDPETGVGETLTTIDPGGGFLLGMAFDDDDLYVALASFVPETSGVWQIDTETGAAARVVDLQGFPNDLTFDKWGNMYVTESIGGAVYRVEEGSNVAELWVQDDLLVGDVEVSPVPFPIGANGIVYDEKNDAVIVANSQVPAIIEIEDNCGTAGVLSVIAAGEDLRGADGLSLGKSGDVYVVSNFNSTLLRVDRYWGDLEVIADGDDGLVFPATAAFGQVKGVDRRSIYVTNFGFGAGDDAPVSLLKIKLDEKSEKFPAGT